MGDLEISGIVHTLIGLMRKTEVKATSVKNWHEHLSVADVELLREITDTIEHMSKRDKSLFYVKLAATMMDSVDVSLNSKNTVALVDLKVFLIKLSASLISVIILMTVTSDIYLGRHFDLAWLKNMWGVFKEMFLK